MKKYAFISVGLFAILLGSCAADLVTGRKAYNWFSTTTDIKLGNQVMHAQLAEIKAQKKSLDKQADKKLFPEIKQVALSIAAISHAPNFPWEFHLADIDVVNAWAAPAGKVMVYTGLYNHPEKALVENNNIDEIAAVLGHEIAHATARHVTESLSRNYSVLLAGQVALSAVSSAGSAATANLFNQVFVRGMNIFVPSYSRKNESEADKIGLFYMARAGYNPRAARDLWYRACKKRGGKSSIYASHPSSCSRAKNLETLMPAALALYEQVNAGVSLPTPPKIPK